MNSDSGLVWYPRQATGSPTTPLSSPPPPTLWFTKPSARFTFCHLQLPGSRYVACGPLRFPSGPFCFSPTSEECFWSFPWIFFQVATVCRCQREVKGEVGDDSGLCTEGDNS
ncbi:hypothetical protein Hanom_Chr09g00764281 [Helianthus anomalus]